MSDIVVVGKVTKTTKRKTNFGNIYLWPFLKLRFNCDYFQIQFAFDPLKLSLLGTSQRYSLF